MLTGPPDAGAALPPLRPYQAQALEAIVTGLRDGGRGQAVMACGTGKTRVAAEAAARLTGPGTVLVVLVPSIALAAQTITAWPASCPVDQVFAVCSDTTVADSAMRACDLTVPVSTDTAQVAAWLAAASGRVLIVATYESAARVADALRRTGQAADLTVCDEAHRLAGAAGKATAAILAPDVLPDRRRLYLTATPRVATSLGRDGELAVASMDDPALFGPVLHTYPFGQAIADGYLKQYRIVVAALADSQVSQLLRASPGLAAAGVPVQMAAAQAALAMTAARFGLRRCIAFLPRVDHARQFAATLPATLKLLPAGQRPRSSLSAGFVHGGMNARQRERVLSHLRTPPGGGWTVIANARCLSEGVDVPAVDSVLFAAPKTSVIDIVQAVGRALRYHPDARTATIIVPALLPDPSDVGQDDADGGRYQPVLRVIRAMSAHDTALAADLGTARTARSASPAGPHPGLPGQIVVQAPPGTVEKALDALRLRIIDGTTSAWQVGYGHARAFHREHGHLTMPVVYTCSDGYRLGAWLTRQRILRNKDQLATDRIALLDEQGIIWNVLDDNWMSAYQEACAYRDTYGHLEIPEGHLTADGKDLALWIRGQRIAYRKHKLPAERIALLEKIGLSWDAAEARWQRRFTQLTDALARCGGQRNLPPGSDEAIWLETQRMAMRAGTLPEDKLTLLEGAGLVLSRTSQWDVNYQALKDFHAAHGHWRVPRGTRSPNGTDLAGWIIKQRSNRSKGRLSARHERLLNEIGFPWDPYQDRWQARYAEARAFKDKHGNLDTPVGPLNSWLYQQRKKHRQNRLTDHEERLLRELGVLDNPPGPQT